MYLEGVISTIGCIKWYWTYSVFLNAYSNGLFPHPFEPPFQPSFPSLHPPHVMQCRGLVVHPVNLTYYAWTIGWYKEKYHNANSVSGEVPKYKISTLIVVTTIARSLTRWWMDLGLHYPRWLQWRRGVLWPRGEGLLAVSGGYIHDWILRGAMKLGIRSWRKAKSSQT